jgi:hypothetical protein
LKQRHIPSLTLVVFLLFLTSSCDLLRDSPFEVSAWSPGEGFHDPAGNISLTLEFSHNPDQASVEHHFSFTEDGNRVAGAFFWEGRRLIFRPHGALEKNRDYAIILAADASDEGGLSMDQRFEGNFTTREDHVRPRFLSMVPENGTILYETQGELRLGFSPPVSLTSLRENVSLSPAMGGIWSRGAAEEIVRFIPAEPWKQGQRYELRISASLSGDNNMSTGKDMTLVFTAGDDRGKPFLKGAWQLDGEGSMKELEEASFPATGAAGISGENSGWEKGSRIRLEFSEPVDTSSVQSCLVAESAPPLVLETMPGLSGEMVFRFAEKPAWGSRFSIQIKPGIRDAAGNESREDHLFRIYADGLSSKPPSLIGIRLPMAPGNTGAENQELWDYSPENLFYDLPIANGEERYPYEKRTATWIELYIDTAPGAEVDLFSVMDLFHVETTNHAFSFSPRSIQGENFSVPGPRPGWEPYIRLEIRGYLINTINAGVVSFCLDPGLGDTMGNQNEKPFRISLLK